MTLKGGYVGRILRVNLSTGEVKKEPYPEEWARLFIGGKGVAARILYGELKAGIDPLSPDNKLVIATGPLTGTLAPSSSRTIIATKSPLTGIWLDSCFGGHDVPFGPALKYAGYDVLVVEGVSEKPVYILVDDDHVDICDASWLWGKDTHETYDELLKKHGRDFSVICIGPAGENLVKMANIMHAKHRAAGRGGAGAVMGSKKLKAVVVRGTGAVEVAEPEEFYKVAVECHRKLWYNPIMGIRYGKLGGGQTRYGTPVLINILNTTGILPTRNFSTGVFELADNVSGETMREKQVVKDKSCTYCPCADRKVSKVKEGKYAGIVDGGPEYESIDTLGPVCGVGDLGAVTMADLLCDKLGLDTISTGVTIAFAMECFEKGLITKEDTEGLELKFGNGDALVEMVKRIAYRKGLGNLLAEGSRRAAQKIGRGSEKFAMNVKGLELPGYDPRGCVGHGLAYATSDRGGCHLRAWVVGAEIGMGGPPRFDRFAPEPGKGKFTADVQNTVAALSSLILCVNVGYALGPEDYAKLLTAATGIEWTADSFVKAGERIWNLTRLFNVREGISRKDDTLPWRIMNEPLPAGLTKGQVLTREKLDKMLDEYYEYRGWDKNGIPTPEKLRELGLEGLARGVVT